MATKLVKGNTAVAIGALYAGADCFFGYPITPASEILHEAAHHFPRLGRRFVQAESEEAAINMVYGGAATGRRVMTASSGPGISLMQEGISYLAGAQLPAVIVNIMRAGPGLGNIGPEQGDYTQCVKGGGHGNYRTMVLAPNCVQEMCDMTRKAFDLAFAYRLPVYVLADAVLGQMIEPLRFPDRAVEPTIDETWAVAATPETRGNLVTSIFLDFNELEEFNQALQEKYARINATETDVETHRADDADIVLVSYGISSRIARSAVDEARAAGIRAGLVRPKTLFPFPAAVLRELTERGARVFLSVEMSNGQMAEDIRLALEGRAPVELVSRLGGNLITMNQIMAAIRAQTQGAKQ
jgi:2-oxoisovalerate ferredoxin oxidoreductase alpha subunit